MNPPDDVPQYIELLCQHLADVQDRYERSPVFQSTTEAALHVKLQSIGEVIGLRRALAVALGLDPDQASGKEGPADVYFVEWRERTGR